MELKNFDEFNVRLTESEVINEGGDWVGTKVKGKDGKTGKVVGDDNPGRYRTLSIKWSDGSEYDLVLNNVGPNPEDKEEVEVELGGKDASGNKKWYKLAESVINESQERINTEGGTGMITWKLVPQSAEYGKGYEIEIKFQGTAREGEMPDDWKKKLEDFANEVEVKLNEIPWLV